MKKLIFVLIATLVLVGCATATYETRMLDQGRFAQVYVNQSGKERERVASEILSKTGGAKDTKFKAMLSDYMEEASPKGNDFFLSMQQILAQGVKDGLISSPHQAELGDQLLYLLGRESIQTPSLLDDARVNAAFPNVKSYRARIASGEFEKLERDPNVAFQNYFSIYQFFVDAKDEKFAERVRVAMHLKAANLLKSNDSSITTVSAVSPFFDYIKFTGDRTLDSAIVDALAKIRMTRGDLTIGHIPALFPDFAKAKLSSSVIKLNITSQNDEFIVGEVIEELKKTNEWLEISDEATRKLTIGRIRFQESRPNPSNMTETVQDLNFLTILFIPKNASVMFDYSTSEYAVQWNMSVMDSKSKVTKSISGQRKAKKVECRNMRFQNVFGGTGPLSNMPNDAVANFCGLNANVDFDQTRAAAVHDIADEINKTFLAAN